MKRRLVNELVNTCLSELLLAHGVAPCEADAMSIDLAGDSAAYTCTCIYQVPGLRASNGDACAQVDLNFLCLRDVQANAR